MQQIDTPPKFQNICTEGDHLNCLFVTVLRKNRHGDMSLVVCLAAWKKKNTIGKLKKSRVRNLAGIIIKYNLIDIYITRFFAVHIVLELLNLYTYKYALRSLKYILLKAFFVNNISKLQCEWLSRDQIYYIPLHAPLRSIKGHFYSSVILPVLAVVILQGILVFKKYLKWC